MRLLIAMMKHETNMFLPVPTPLARFGPSFAKTGPGPLYGEAAAQRWNSGALQAASLFSGSSLPRTGFVHLAPKLGK
jgi:hypothetical protein